MRPRSKSPKRNTVSVRLNDDDMAAVEAAAGKARISPWVRDAAVEKARNGKTNITISHAEIVSEDPDVIRFPLPREKGEA